jgi:hypothetical protein
MDGGTTRGGEEIPYQDQATAPDVGDRCFLLPGSWLGLLPFSDIDLSLFSGSNQWRTIDYYNYIEHNIVVKGFREQERKHKYKFEHSIEWEPKNRMIKLQDYLDSRE